MQVWSADLLIGLAVQAEDHTHLQAAALLAAARIVFL